MDLNRLYTALLNTGLQSKDNPLYQVIHSLIEGMLSISKQIGLSSARLFTAGSVIFVGSSGSLDQDNTNFFWDNINKRLSLGTNLLKQRLHIVPELNPGDITFGGNGPNIGCNAYHTGVAGSWKYIANGFAGVVSLQDIATGDFVVYTAASGLAGNNIALLDKFHVFQNGAVTVTNGLTADTVVGNTSVSAPTTIGTTSLRVGSDSTSFFRDITIEATGIAVRDSGNTTYRALRCSNFGISDGGQITTSSRGLILNTGDGSWKIQNQANTANTIINAGGSITIGTSLAIIPNGDGVLYFSNVAQTATNPKIQFGGLASLSSPSDGVFRISNNAISAGFDLDGTTDGTASFLQRGSSAGAQVKAASIRGTAVTFANRPATPIEGMLVSFTDSTVNTWGTTITGGGTNHVLGYYNGTNWTVAAI